VSDNDAGQHDSGATADPDHGRRQADAARHLRRWKLVADDPEAQREDAASGAL
jgi:hypothetical protein